MTTQLPTRSQLEGAMEFFASFVGSAYKDENELVDIPTDLTIQALRRQVEVTADGMGTVVRIPEEYVQKHFERWLRVHWDEIVDCMVDNELAVDDEEIEEKSCPKTTAHGGHYWDASLFPDHFGPGAPERVRDPDDHTLPEFHCIGIKVHPVCMIGKGVQHDA